MTTTLKQANKYELSRLKYMGRHTLKQIKQEELKMLYQHGRFDVDPNETVLQFYIDDLQLMAHQYGKL